MDAEVQKISDEDLNKIKELNQYSNNLIRRAGEIYIQKRGLEKEEFNLDNAIEQLNTARATLVNKLQTEFGSTGIVNMTDGTFIPTPADK